MKNLTLIGLFVMIITSCQKMENLNPFEKKHKDKPCATVSSETVPQVVKDGFAKQYPNENVTTWFNKDNNGYCAEFTRNGVKNLAQFNNDGSFVKEDSDNNQDGEHQDSNNEKGCSCELEGGD